MHGGVRTRPNIKNKTRQGKKCTSLLLQVQGSHKTKSEGHDSVKTGSVVKYSYKSSKSRLEVHSMQGHCECKEVTRRGYTCTVMPVGVPSSALQSKKSMALSRQD